MLPDVLTIFPYVRLAFHMDRAVVGKLLASGGLLAGCGVLASLFPPAAIAVAATPSLIEILRGLLAGAAGNIGANLATVPLESLVDRLTSGPGLKQDILSNEHLRRLIGDAVAAQILATANDPSLSADDVARLDVLAQRATPAWMEWIIAGHAVDLNETTATRYFAMPEETFAEAVALDETQWVEFLQGLDNVTADESIWSKIKHSIAAPKRHLNSRPLSAAGRSRVARSLHTNMPRAIYEMAKIKFSEGDPSFAALHLRLMRELMNDVRDVLATVHGLAVGQEEIKSQLRLISDAVTIKAPAVAGRAPIAEKADIDHLIDEIQSGHKEIITILQGMDKKLDAIKDETTETHRIVIDMQQRVRAFAAGTITAESIKVRNNFTVAKVVANRLFTGRADELTRLNEALSQGPVAIVHALTGEGGVGKTELAKAYALIFADSYDGVWWLDAAPAAFAAALTALYKSVFDREAEQGKRPEELCQELVAHFEPDRHLLILDNVETREHLQAFHITGRSRVLATTRMDEKTAAGVQRFLVDVLPVADAVDLMRKQCQNVRDVPSIDELTDIASELGGHSLAVALAGAYLANTPDATAAETLDRIRSGGLGEAQPRAEGEEYDPLALKYRHSVWTCLSLHFARPDVQAAMPVLHAVCFCHLVGIPLDLVGSAIGWNIDQVRKAAQSLSALSIMKYDKTLSVHRLTQSLVRSRLEARTAELVVAGTISCLLKHFQDSLVHTNWPRQDMYAPHAIALLKYTSGWDPTAQRSALANGLARYLHGRVRFLDAEKVLREALTMDRRLHDGDHADTARSLNDLAVVLDSLGRSKEAEVLHRDALAMRRRLFPGDHPDVALSLNNYAGMLKKLGRAKEAEPLLRDTLAMRRRLFPGDHQAVADSLDSYSVVLTHLGRAKEAEPFLRDALAMRRRLFPGDHPDVAMSLNNYAYVLRDLGRAKEAELHYRDALAMNRRLFPGDHPGVAAILGNYAGMLKKLGRAKEAEPHYRDALAMVRRLFPGDHPDVAMCLNNYANVLKALGRAKEAEPYHRDALAMYRRLFPGDHPHVAMCLNNYAGVLHNLGRAKEAEPLYREALAMRRRLFPGDHPDVAMSLNNFADFLVNQGKLREAYRMAKEAVAMAIRCLPAGHPDKAKHKAMRDSIRKRLKVKER